MLFMLSLTDILRWTSVAFLLISTILFPLPFTPPALFSRHEQQLDSCLVITILRVTISKFLLMTTPPYRPASPPAFLCRRVRQLERYVWAVNQGVNEDEVFSSLTEDIQRDVRRHLSLELIKKVSE